MLSVLLLTPAWLAGIFLQGWLNLPALWWWIATSGGVGLALVFWLYNFQQKAFSGSRIPALAPLCLVAWGLGALRLIWAAPSTGPDNLTYYTGPENNLVILTGLVSAEPTYSPYSDSFRVSVQQIRMPGEEKTVAINGELYVHAFANNAVSRGDLVELTGNLAEPEEITGDNFPYREWLARQGIFASMSFPGVKVLAHEQDFFLTRWFYSLNKAARQIIVDNVPDEEGALLVSILLGDKTLLSSQTRQAFTDSGVAHILVVSGSNITILASLISIILTRFFMRRTVLVVTLGTILFYVLLVGPSPPVLRAGVMGALAIGGLALGREYVGLVGLAASALLMTLWQPNILMDVSFQLSFMATLGLVVLAQPWQAKTRHWPPILQEGVVLTVAAELMILPLLAFYFRQLSLVTVLTNLLAVTSIAVIMATGGAAIVAGWIFGGWFPFLAKIFGGFAWLPLAYLLVMVKLCAGLPFATLSLDSFHPVWIFVYYWLLGLAVWWWRGGHKSPAGKQILRVAGSWAGLTVAGIITLGVWLAAWLV